MKQFKAQGPLFSFYVPESTKMSSFVLAISQSEQAAILSPKEVTTIQRKIIEPQFTNKDRPYTLISHITWDLVLNEETLSLPLFEMLYSFHQNITEPIPSMYLYLIDIEEEKLLDEKTKLGSLIKKFDYQLAHFSLKKLISK